MKHEGDTIQELSITLKFLYFGVGSLVKSIIFRTISHHSYKNKDLISAAITGYYSLLHLTLALMYLCHNILIS